MSLSPRIRALGPSVRRLASKGWSADAIARLYSIGRDDVRSILTPRPVAAPRPRAPARPKPDPPEWGWLSGQVDEDPAEAETSLPATIADEDLAEGPGQAGEPTPPPAMPTIVAEDWGSPHASSVPGGRVAEDAPAEGPDPLPATSPPPSCSAPRSRRWREPGQAGRLDPRYRDD